MSHLSDPLQSTLRGAYGLEHELGGGGMSRVFLATETAFDRRFGKALPPELSVEVRALQVRSTRSRPTVKA